MNELEKQRILSDLSGQGRVYAIGLLVLIVYVLIASGVVQFATPPRMGATAPPLPPYSTLRAD